MASIREEIVVEVSPAKVWAVVRDVGAIHQRLVRGFVTDCRLEGDARIVTFANGLVVRELIVDAWCMAVPKSVAANYLAGPATPVDTCSTTGHPVT